MILIYDHTGSEHTIIDTRSEHTIVRSWMILIMIMKDQNTLFYDLDFDHARSYNTIVRSWMILIYDQTQS